MRGTVPGVGLALALLVTATACGGDDGEARPSDTTAPVVEPTPLTPTTVPVTDVTTLAGVEVGLEPVATLDQPTAMAVRPGVPDRAYVAQRAGEVVDLDLTTGDATTVLDLSDETTTDGERGVLGLAASPSGEHLYVSSTDLNGDSRVAEYTLGPDGAVDPASRRVVFNLDQPFANHNGGNIVFGPDGYLYLGLGDGGSQGDPLGAGQDPDQLQGSLIRIDPRGEGGSAYAIPADNPFVGEEGARPEVWLKGVRNPWRFSFDPATGDLWIGDVGGDRQEEVDWLPAGPDGTGAGRGANLGWSEMEGDAPLEDGVEPDDHTPPVLTYPHDDGGCSVTGGVVYRGEAIPDLAGAYLYGDNCLPDVRALALDRGTGEVLDDAVVATGAGAPVSFGVDATGEVYLLDLTGPVSRLTPTP